jgi:Ca-activated chloride channel homolog
MTDLSNFHLLRPLWLWALIPALLVWVLILIQQGNRHRLRNVIAPHLLEHLVRRAGRRSWTRPAWIGLPALLLAVLTLSGPAWERQKTPFVQDEAPLVVALDLSPSMDAIDVPPTRLERAKQKVRDLLGLRPGSRTGLIAYAGSTHMVLPLTDDAKVLELYLFSLETGIMPVSGKDPAKALKLAEEMLAKETAAGTILFVTDGIGLQYAPLFAGQKKESRHQVLVLAVGTAQGGPVRSGKDGFLADAGGRRVTAVLDRKGLEALEQQAGTYVVGSTIDNSDLQKLIRRVNTRLKSLQAVDEKVPWEDYGYYLVFLALPFSLLWFRKGWTIRWQ